MANMIESNLPGVGYRMPSYRFQVGCQPGESPRRERCMVVSRELSSVQCICVSLVKSSWRRVSNDQATAKVATADQIGPTKQHKNSVDIANAQ